MFAMDGDTVTIDMETTRLDGFRLEDMKKAPGIIIFINDEDPRLMELQPGKPVPVRLRSRNMENDIQVISYKELNEQMLVGK